MCGDDGESSDSTAWCEGGCVATAKWRLRVHAPAVTSRYTAKRRGRRHATAWRRRWHGTEGFGGGRALCYVEFSTSDLYSRSFGEQSTKKLK